MAEWDKLAEVQDDLEFLEAARVKNIEKCLVKYDQTRLVPER